jgi:hypothetical protein
VSYDRYIRWRHLTNNGRRNRDEMSPESQAEYDALGIYEEVRLTPGAEGSLRLPTGAGQQ